MTGPNPTDRGKLGTKRHHVLTDGQGIPLCVVKSTVPLYSIISYIIVIYGLFEFVTVTTISHNKARLLWKEVADSTC